MRLEVDLISYLMIHKDTYKVAWINHTNNKSQLLKFIAKILKFLTYNFGNGSHAIPLQRVFLKLYQRIVS